MLPVEKELLEILNSGMNPYVDQIQSSDLQLMYKKERRGIQGSPPAPCWTPAWLTPGPPAPPRGTQTTQETEKPETEQPGETDAGTETPGTTPPEGTETGTGEPGSTGSETGEPGTQGPEGDSPIRMTPGLCSLKGPARGGSWSLPAGAGPWRRERGCVTVRTLPARHRGGERRQRSAPGWLLPDVA